MPYHLRIAFLESSYCGRTQTSNRIGGSDSILERKQGDEGKVSDSSQIREVVSIYSWNLALITYEVSLITYSVRV
jgi:hypothetical protein